jgi:magnesium chelatase family protein
VKTALLARGVLPTEPSAAVAERVLAARERQLARLGGLGWRTNAEVPGPVLRKQLPVPAGVDLLTRAIARGQLSARGVDKVLRLAWTIADLAGVPTPQLDHLHAALAMRGGTELERGAA